MRIAFDVKGTIEGPHQEQVLSLLKALQAQGHEIIVWSNMFSFALDAIADHGLDAEPWPKRMKGDYDYDENKYLDLAIEDDTMQDWLAAKRIVWVHELANMDQNEILNFANQIGLKNDKFEVHSNND